MKSIHAHTFQCVYTSRTDKQQHNHLCRLGNIERSFCKVHCCCMWLNFLPMKLTSTISEEQSRFQVRSSLSLFYSNALWSDYTTLKQTKLICEEAQLVAHQYLIQSSLPRPRRWCPLSMRLDSCMRALQNVEQTCGKFKMSWRCRNLLQEVSHQTARCRFAMW